MKIIDPHIHLFALQQGDYHWLKADNPPFWPNKIQIAKDFSETDLQLDSPLTLAGFVHIEAGFDNQKPWREITWLEQHCQGNFRTIALLDITLAPAIFNQQLRWLLAYESVVGIRYILDDNVLDILSSEYSLTNLKTLADNHLSFECQFAVVDSATVDFIIDKVLSIKGLKICLNHAGFPPVLSKQSDSDDLKSQQYRKWQYNLKRLSVFKNLYVKCAGFELFTGNLSNSELLNTQQAIIHFCLECFGVSRVMLASNFPLSTWRENYQNTWLNYQQLAFTPIELEQLCYDNARQYYFNNNIL